MKAFILLPLLLGSLLAWEPLPKLDNEKIEGLHYLNDYAKHLHYSDKLLYFLDGQPFEILGKLYILNNQETHYKDRLIYQSLSTDTYYIAQGNPITEENPFGWKKIEKPYLRNFLGYMLFIDFPKDPQSYRAYSWVLVKPDFTSFKKLIGADPKGGFRWYVDEGWKKRVVIEKEDNAITFKTRGISAPLLPEQEGYYFGYQAFSGKWEAFSVEFNNILTTSKFSHKNKFYPLFYTTSYGTELGACQNFYSIIINNKRYKYNPKTNSIYKDSYYQQLIGYKEGCIIYKAREDSDEFTFYMCKTDNAIGESPIQKNPYRGEITTDTSRLPKPTSDYKKCWE